MDGSTSRRRGPLPGDRGRPADDGPPLQAGTHPFNMGAPGRPAWRNYALGLVFGLGAIGLRLATSPIVGGGQALPTFFLAVAAAACLGGAGPALATLGVMLAASPLLPSPPGSEAATGGATALGLGLYALSGSGVALVGGRVRRSLARCEADRRADLIRAEERLRAARAEEDRLLREQVRLREEAEAQAVRLEELLREVREKNAFLTAILAQVPAGLLVSEAGTTRILLCNDEARRISRGSLRPGLPVDLEGADGLVGRRPDGSTYGPEDWPLARTLRRGEVVVDEEIELEFGDGGRRRVSVSSGPALDESGRAIAAVAAILDVTARREADVRLAAGERVFRELAEAVTQFVYITRPDDSIAFLNGRWFDYTGVSREDLEPRDAWRASIHPDDVPAIVEARARSRESGAATEIEYRIRGRDGTYRWFLGRWVWMRGESGELTSRIGTVTDIDDQKRAERAARFLADAGARLAALADVETTLREVARLAVPDFADWSAVDVLDPRGEPRRVVAAHDASDPSWVVETISHRYRLRPDMPDGLFQVLAERRPALIPEVTEEVLRSGARNDEHLAALRAFAPLSYMCVPLVGREGVLGALSFATTRASGRRFDQHDLGVAVDLGARAAVAVENARLCDRLREADRRKDEFLATLAHELRNPMAPISNAVSILRFKGAVDPDSRWAHDVIERQVSHLVRLVDDLLDVSRITRDKLELRFGRMDLALAVADAVEVARPALDARRQVLRVDVPPGPIPMVADRTRLAQAIGNLLDNASKFSEAGGAIDVLVSRLGDRVEIQVEDRGAGIPEAHLPRVFDMFAQFTPVLDRDQGGLGIGLALAQGLVELHGGAIEARSPGPGLGSTFIIRLPLEAATPEERRQDSAVARGGDAPGRAQVLVVDDSEDIAESLGRLLSLYGCEVHLAYDGETAFRMADTLRPDIAVLDIGLPGMNGYEVAEAIRREPWGRDVVLIAVTGWGRANDRRRSAEAGFDHHLVKPVEPASLARIIADSASA